MKIELKPLQCVTSAPEDYDYVWSRTIIENLYVDERGRSCRLAQNEDEWHFNQQMMRFGSGNHLVIDNQIQLDVSLENGWLKPTNDHKFVFRKQLRFGKVFDWGQEKTDEMLAQIDKTKNIDGVNCRTMFGGLGLYVEYRGKESQFTEIISAFDPFVAETIKFGRYHVVETDDDYWSIFDQVQCNIRNNYLTKEDAILLAKGLMDKEA